MFGLALARRGVVEQAHRAVGVAVEEDDVARRLALALAEGEEVAAGRPPVPRSGPFFSRNTFSLDWRMPPRIFRQSGWSSGFTSSKSRGFSVSVPRKTPRVSLEVDLRGDADLIEVGRVAERLQLDLRRRVERRAARLIVGDRVGQHGPGLRRSEVAHTKTLLRYALRRCESG